jgi:hypothetical protein
MNRYPTLVAGLFGLLMMALPSIASADVSLWHSQNVHPAVLEEGVAPQQNVTLAYYHRPWACSDRYFRHHHPYLCR